MNRVNSLLILTLFFLASHPLSAATILAGYYIGVTATGSGSPQVFVLPQVMAAVPIEQLDLPHRYQPQPAFPNDYFDQSAQALVYGSAAAYDEIRAYAQSSADVTRMSRFDAVGGAESFASIGFSAVDAITFSSAALPIGSPVEFELGAVLESELSTDSLSNCAPSAAASAGLGMTGPGGALLFAPLEHTTCGKGSSSMTFTGKYSGKVGEKFNFRADLGVSTRTTGSFANPGAYITTADARNTARISFRVLTARVSFTSDSGAAYSPSAAIPEPATAILTGCVVAGVIFTLRRHHSA